VEKIPVVEETPVTEKTPVRDGGNGKDRFQLIIGIVCGFIAAAVLAYPMSWYTYEGKAVAKVNGKAIRYGEFHQALRETSGSQALDYLVQKVLIENEAAKQGVSVKEAEVSAQLKLMMGTSMSEKDLENFLKDSHMSRETLNDRIRLQLLAEKLAGEVKADDEELREFYEEYKDLEYNNEPYEEVKDQVKQDYEAFMKPQLIPQMVQDLMEKAKITTYW
jgi:foldase protein PrsA